MGQFNTLSEEFRKSLRACMEPVIKKLAGPEVVKPEPEGKKPEEQPDVVELDAKEGTGPSTA